MVDLDLDIDEGIILQSEKIDFYGEIDEETEIKELILTNKNLICVVDKGWFKTDIVTEKHPLGNIKIVDNKPQILETKAEFGDPAFQILLTTGKRIQFIFDKSDKNEIQIWVGTIKNVINGTNEVYTANNTDTASTHIETQNTKRTQSVSDAADIGEKRNSVHSKSSREKDKRKNTIGSLVGALSNLDIQSAMDKTQTKIVQFSNQIKGELSQLQQQKVNYSEPQTQAQEQPSTPPQPQEQPTQSANTADKNINIGKALFCSNCGTKLSQNSKFCHNCGAAVGTVKQEETVPPIPQPQQQVQQGHYKERQQEFVGKVLKCPNCGAVISETTAVCPDCGMRITGKAAISSIEQFKKELMELDNSRMGGLKGVLFDRMLVDPADERKVTLIKNFPIPNSVDDIIEFMLLAIANIDVGLSKGKWDKNVANDTIYTIKRTISNAWVAKMIQAYNKAEITFPNDPAFKKIQKLYFDKALELKIIKK